MLLIISQLPNSTDESIAGVALVFVHTVRVSKYWLVVVVFLKKRPTSERRCRRIQKYRLRSSLIKERMPTLLIISCFKESGVKFPHSWSNTFLIQVSQQWGLSILNILKKLLDHFEYSKAAWQRMNYRLAAALLLAMVLGSWWFWNHGVKCGKLFFSARFPCHYTACFHC